MRRLAILTAIAALAPLGAGCGGSNPSPPPAGATAAQWAECLDFYNDEAHCRELVKFSAEMNRGVDELNAEIARINAEQP